jgi:hypothetical protein
MQNIWQNINRISEMGLSVNILKTEYLNIRSDRQNMKGEDNIEIKGITAYMCLGSAFTNSSKCKE